MSGNKIYKSAGGQEVDLQKLILKNENVRAVGNMNVNARGDVLNSNNTATATRSSQVNKNYRKQIGNVAQDVPVVNSKKAAQLIAEKYVQSHPEPEAPAEVTVDEMIAGLDDEVSIEVDEELVTLPDETVALEKAPSGGLAAALAKAREIEQKPLPTPREEERSGSGVKKI